MSKSYFYGIYGIRFIRHGSWNDPELIWHGKSFNYYDVETPLYEAYSEYATENNINRAYDDTFFPPWVKKNAYLAREFLQNLLDNKCFYGGAA